jgi:hypothetical protein
LPLQNTDPITNPNSVTDLTEAAKKRKHETTTQDDVVQQRIVEGPILKVVENELN